MYKKLFVVEIIFTDAVINQKIHFCISTIRVRSVAFVCRDLSCDLEDSDLEFWH